MKTLFCLVAAIILCSVSAFAQNQTSNSSAFTAVTPPAAPTITSLTGLSASGKIYTGTKMPIIGTGYSSSCVVNVDGVAQAASTFVFVSSTEIDFTIPASLGSSAGTAHTATVSCPTPVLAMNANTPVILPNATHGVPYSADLVQLSKLTGGIQPYNISCDSPCGLPAMGLSLSPLGVINGTPSGIGSVPFSATVKDSSGLAISKVNVVLSAKNN